MQIFNIKKIKSFPFEEREKNVFFKTREFKTRIIKLSSREQIKSCKMDSYVIFYVIEGSAKIMVDNELSEIKEGDCLISEPATLSLRTENGVKILGIQVEKQSK